VPETARRIAEKLGARPSLRCPSGGGGGRVGIVTPTTTHFDLAKQLLLEGKHLLVEKPMTKARPGRRTGSTRPQHRCALQVAHRALNPVFAYLETVATEPRFIETHRLSPYPAAARTSASCST